MSDKIPVTFEYKDTGLAAIGARINGIAGGIEKQLGGLGKLNAAGERLNRAFAPLKPIAAAAAIGIAAIAAGAGGMSVGVKGALDYGGALSDLNSRTGVAIDSLAIMEQAFINNGLGAEKVGPSIDKLNKALAGVNEEGEPTNKVFSQLGLSVEELGKLSPDKALDRIGASINGLQDPAQRTIAAMGLFGKSGGELLTLFRDGSFTNAADQVGEQAEILKNNAALFDKISDTLGLTSTKFRGFFVGMAEQIAPVIEPLADLFAGSDFADSGRQFGAAIALGIQAIADGSLWGMVTDSALISVGTAVNALWAGVQGVLAAAAAPLLEIIKGGLVLFQVVSTPDFWQGMGKALIGIALSFNASLLDGIAGLLDNLRNIPVIGDKLGAAPDAVRASASAMRGLAGSDLLSGADSLTPAFDRVTEQIGASLANLGGAFTKGLEEASDAVDISELQDRLDSTLNRTGEAVRKLQNDALNKGQADKKAGDAKQTGGLAGSGKSGASRMFAVGGLGVFVKDPMLAESRRQSNLLETIAKNTAKETPNNIGMGTVMGNILRFGR